MSGRVQTELEGQGSRGSSYPTIAGAAAVAVGIAVFTGWTFHIEFLKRIAPGWHAMNPTTAACFTLLGIALATYRATPSVRWYRVTIGTIVCTVGLIRLAAVLLHLDAHIERIFFASSVGQSVIGPNTAVGFVLLGIAVAVLSSTRPWLVMAGQTCTIGAALISLVVLTDYAAVILGLFDIQTEFPTALHTAISILVVATGLLAVNPTRGLVEARTDLPEKRIGRLPFSVRLLTASFTILVITLSAAFWGEEQSDRSSDKILLTRTHELEISRMLSLMQDAEIGQRGYLLTEDTSYLKPYDDAVIEIAKLRERFKTLAAGDSDVEGRAKRLDDLISTELGVLAETNDLERHYAHDAAVALTKTGRGKAAMDQIRQIVSDITVESTRAIEKQQAEQNRITATVRITELVGLLTLVSAGITLFRQMLQAVEAQRRARKSQAAAVLEATTANRSKTAFLATMSHELRTPMTAIMGMCDLLIASEQTADQRQITRMLIRSAQTLLGLLNDILDLSKIEAGRLTLEAVDFKLSSLLEDVNALFTSTASQKGLVLTIDTAPGERDVFSGDSKRLQQILVNLLGNAVKFTGQGGITVRHRHRALNNVETIVEFEVEDTGVGISAEAKARLFREFEQEDTSTSRRFGGSGLGLSICKRLAEAMGGQIRVESEKGKGSTFIFSVRLRAGDESRIPEKIAEVSPLTMRNHTGLSLDILLAEDTASLQFLVTKMLSLWGHRVVAVNNGKEAVAAAANRAWDIVLMDMQMPVMDGSQATALIRAGGGPSAKVPIIAITADALQDHQEKYLAAGCNTVITKPLDWAVLARKMTELTDAQADGRQEESADTGSVSLTTETDLDEAAQDFPILNHAAINELIETFDRETTVNLIASTVKNMRQQVLELQRSLSNADYTGAKRIAHALKGTSGQFGAARVSETARTIEMADGAALGGAAARVENDVRDATVALEAAAKEASLH